MKKSVWLEGKQVDMYTIGEIADSLGVTSFNVRKWEREGIIPKAKYKIPTEKRIGKGYRVYTKPQVDLIVNTINEYGYSQGVNISHHTIKQMSKEIAEKF